jgi:ParB family chromosome partitioning protein
MEIKEIDMKDIVRNPKQPRQSFDHEKIMELAESIRESGLLQPIVVRVMKNNKYGIVCGERRFRAFEYLKEKKILAIIRDFKDDIDVLEKSLVENWHREDLTSSERENVLAELWNSGHYNKEDDLAKKLGLATDTIQGILRACTVRKKLKLNENVSTRSILDTAGLDDVVKKKTLKKVEKGEIQAQDVRDITKKLKQLPEKEQQTEELERIVKRKKIAKEYEEREFEADKDIADGKRQPDEVTRFESDPDKRHITDFHDLWEKLITTAQADYIEHIKNEKLKREAVKILWDIHNFTLKQLMELGETKMVEHGKKST